jgi:hypothetical protein
MTMPVASNRITLSCPACANPITADVWQVVDVAQQPDLKRTLLRGELNVVTCPHCSNHTAVATPLAYHDPDRELLLILVPSQLDMSGEEQDRTIGRLTNLVMDSLPAEQRKGYLFQPKTFFSMQSLVSEVLRAEGITDEMVRDQMAKGQLLQDLLAQSGDEEAFEKLVEEKKDSLDYEFFLFLSASLDQAREDGEESMAEQLSALRTKLQDLVSPASVPPPEATKGAITREELVERLLAHKDDEDFKTLVAVARPVLEYQFFQALTNQIDEAQAQGDEEKAKDLTELRARILDLVDELDQEAKEALDRAAALLREIAESEDMETAAAEHVDQLDAAFLTVLEANIAAAGQSGHQEVVEKLSRLKEHVISLLEERLPPEMRLINRLLSAPDLDARRTLLQDQKELIDEDFLKLLQLILDDLRSQDQKKAAERLEEIIPEVEAALKEPGDRESSPPQSP